MNKDDPLFLSKNNSRTVPNYLYWNSEADTLSIKTKIYPGWQSQELYPDTKPHERIRHKVILHHVPEAIRYQERYVPKFNPTFKKDVMSKGRIINDNWEWLDLPHISNLSYPPKELTKHSDGPDNYHIPRTERIRVSRKQCLLDIDDARDSQVRKNIFQSRDAERWKSEVFYKPSEMTSVPQLPRIHGRSSSLSMRNY